MLCPVCKTTELKMTERQGIEIDYCPQCRGVWLDRGELDKIIERAGVAEYPAAPPPQQPAAPPPPPQQQPGYPQQPPQPGYPQQQQPGYPQQPPLPGTYPPTPYGGGYRRDDDSDYKYGQQGYGHGYPPKHKKRKSLLGEIFDFD